MANKSIRSSQILSPFGIGQIVNFPQEVSLMVCGLNQWDEVIEQRKIQAGHDKIDEISLRIIEPRLQKLLGVDYFVKPFVYTTSGSKNQKLTIPAVRFPRWHHCTNSKCGAMREVELTLADKKVECSACSVSGKPKFKMIPVRFIAACSDGHIQDVPFKEWVHDGYIPNDNKNHNLSYHSLSGAGDLGSILLKCSCGKKRTLAGLMNVKKNESVVFDSALARIGLGDNEFVNIDVNADNRNATGQYCKGHQPWLGVEGVNGVESCGQHLQVLIRGGSNVHYADIISALYLPETSKKSHELVVRFIEKHGGKSTLKTLYNINKGETLRKMFLDQPVSLLDDVISELISDTENTEETPETVSELRIEEYNYILNGRDSENAAFKAILKTFEGYSERDFLKEYFECVVLVEKLKETRVFRSFSRINPVNTLDMSNLSSGKIKWLPAVEVYGEGIFLKFRDDKIDQWLQTSGSYFSEIINRYMIAKLKRRPNGEQRELNPAFILLHTFAHLLIKRLCFYCGYGSSSLRERIYFKSGEDNRMNGILIYTPSGDSEGSLGGLVRQGKAKNLGRIIKDAIEDARWCSADPVCSDIGMAGGQGPDNVNGAACHNCCIVPETSCEEFNMLLDRATVIGTLEKEIGYFKDL